MDNENILRLLGLAYRGRNLEIGEEPVYAAIISKKARIVFAAKDSSANTITRLKTRCTAASIPFYILLYSKSELGFALGRGETSMVALTDAGLSLSAMEQLNILQEYQETVQKLQGIKKRKSMKYKQHKKK